MNKIKVGGHVYAVDVPMKLDTIEAAAETIDRQSVLAQEVREAQKDGATVSIVLLSKTFGATVEALHYALKPTNSGLSLADLRATVGLPDMGELTNQLQALLSGSGFVSSGEPLGPVSETAAAPPKPSKSKSAAS